MLRNHLGILSKLDTVTTATIQVADIPLLDMHLEGNSNRNDPNTV